MYVHMSLEKVTSVLAIANLFYCIHEMVSTAVGPRNALASLQLHFFKLWDYFRSLRTTLLLDVYCRIKHPSCVIASSSYLPLLFQFQSTVFIRNFCHWSYIFRDVIRSLRDCGLRLDNFSQVHTTLEHNIFKWFCGAMFSCPPMTAFSLHRPRRPRPWDEREGRIQKLSQGSEIKTGLPELDI